MRFYSLFKIGLVILIVSIIWISIIFSNSQKESLDSKLERKEMTFVQINLNGNGLGYYILDISNYSKDIFFIQITDSHGNVIEDKKIETKMAVNYFKFSHTGSYFMKITNFSERSLSIHAEIGDLDINDLSIPLLTSFSGAGIVIVSGYRKLSNQNTAHPEENTS